MSTLVQKLKTLPGKPGVYIFKNSRGDVLYVGKAKNLKNRVKNYFAKLADREPRIEILISQIADLDYVIVSNETESLMLETNLIKEYLPTFNVLMRDDKNYQYLKIDYTTEIPQIYPVRQMGKTIKNTKLFGPYTSGLSVKNTLNLLKKTFHLCANKKIGTRPCFYYHLKRCPGTCIGKISVFEYRKTLKQVETFLSHRQNLVLKTLKTQMQQASRKRLFEKAALLRDQFFSIQRIWEKQKIISPQNLNEDYFSLFTSDIHGVVNLFRVREGKLIHQESFELGHTTGQVPPEIMNSFLKQYYSQTTSLPETILTPYHLPDEVAIKKWLKIKIQTPVRGKRRQLLELGEENARENYEKNFATPQLVLEKLQKFLHIKDLPKRIEAFDISNIQGYLPVGSMVVFENGLPKKNAYRKFIIQKPTLSGGPDDIAMMKEVITRRLKHRVDWPLPNLIVIDGGKGQLRAALVAAKTADLPVPIPIIGLAKRLEEIFTPWQPSSLRLPLDSPVLYLLQRLRDEAHRFAITFYRARHRKALLH